MNRTTSFPCAPNGRSLFHEGQRPFRNGCVTGRIGSRGRDEPKNALTPDDGPR